MREDVFNSLDQMKTHEGRTISPNTVRKHLRNLKSVLLHACERKAISVVPVFVMPKERMRNARDTFTRDEIKEILKATKIFHGKPIGGMDAADWWKNLIVFIHATAARVQTVILARWDWLNGNVLQIEKEPGVKTEYELILNNEALRAIGEMRSGIETPADHIFPWPYNTRHLHRCFKRLVIAAGLPEHRRFGFWKRIIKFILRIAGI